MKRITLLRHAKSSWDDVTLDDFDRPLSPRGRRSAPEMGRRLKVRDEVPDLVISSPAKRAISSTSSRNSLPSMTPTPPISPASTGPWLISMVWKLARPGVTILPPPA